MILTILTLTHNRKQKFLQNFKYNLDLINNFLEKNTFLKINWIINCDDKSIQKNDFKEFNLTKINFYFFEYNYSFLKRYFDLMIKIKSDFIWCLEDDDRILDITFLNELKEKKNYFFYYKSNLSKITEYNYFYFYKKTVNFYTLQLSQMVFLQKDIKHFYLKHKFTNFFKVRDYIDHDEIFIEWILKNKKYSLIQKFNFYQFIDLKTKDNMSFEKGLKEWI